MDRIRTFRGIVKVRNMFFFSLSAQFFERCWATVWISRLFFFNSYLFIFFLSYSLNSFLDAAKCQVSEMPEPFKIPAMVEHVFVWEDCSAKQSCFSPDSFFFSSQENLVLAPPNAFLRQGQTRKSLTSRKGTAALD